VPKQEQVASPTTSLRHGAGRKGILVLSLASRTTLLFYPCIKYINSLWGLHPIKAVVFAGELQVPRQPKVKNGGISAVYVFQPNGAFQVYNFKCKFLQ